MALVAPIFIGALGPSARGDDLPRVIPNSPHATGATAIALASDEERLATGGGDGLVKLWDVINGRLLRTFRGHTGRINSVALSQDGAFVFAASDDKTIIRWDAATGKLLQTFVGHTDEVRDIALSTDGTRLLSRSNEAIKLWDSATAALLRTFELHPLDATIVILSPGAALRVASTGYDKVIRVWDAGTGELIHALSGHTDAVTAIDFSTDGARIASASRDTTVRLWDTATGKLIHTFEGHSGTVSSVALSRDGNLILSGSTDDTAKLWDAASGQLVKTFKGHSDDVASVALSPDGKTALSGSDDKTIKLWNTGTGEILRTIESKAGRVSTVAFSPDGARIVAVRRDWIPFLDDPIGLFAAATGKLILTFDDPKEIAFSRDGAQVFWTGDLSLKLQVFDASTGRPVRAIGAYGDWFPSVTFSPDGKRFLSSGSIDSTGNTIRLWDAENGQLLRSLDAGHSQPVYSVALSPDGSRVLSASTDHTVKLWDLATGKVLQTFEGDAYFDRTVAFSADGKQVLTVIYRGPNRKTAKLWDAASGKAVQTFRGDAGSAVAFWPSTSAASSGNNQNARVLTGAGQTAKLWDAASGELLKKFDLHADVATVAFSPDGKQVLAGGGDRLMVWDAGSGEALQGFDGLGGVNSAAFSPDRKRVLSGSDDKTIKLWDVASGLAVKTFEGHTDGVRSVAISPDGKTALSGSLDRTMRLWSLESGEELAALSASRSGEWLTFTPAGFFAASDKGADRLLHVVQGFKTYSILQFYKHLHRPDLVAEWLKGDHLGKYLSAKNVLSLESILESGDVPKIERLLDREKREGGKAELAVRLTDRGGGIGEKVVWRVNGVAQGAGTASGLGGAARPGRYVVVEQTLRFDPTQTNEIEVVAYNGKGWLATLPLRFSIDPIFGVIDKPKPRLFVLAVGIDKYLRPDWRLSNAVNDVNALGSALKAVAGAFFGMENVEVTTLLDEQATEKGIAAAFDELAVKVQPQDVFLLHLSGHGRAIQGTGPGTGWFFLPQDFDVSEQTVADNAISASTLEAWLRKINALKSVVVLDACESGYYEKSRSGDNLVTESQIAQFAYATGRSTIAAAPAGDAAYEGYDGHGIMTYAMLEAMNRPEGAPAEPIDLLGLASHVSLRVIEISTKNFGIVQSPKTDVKDNFTFGIRQAVLKSAAAPCQIPNTAQEPTHIVGPVDVRTKPAEQAAISMALPKNSLVTVTGCEGAWALIARRGKEIGYVPYRVLDAAN